MRYRAILITLLAAFVFASSGCKKDRAEDESRILAHDPTFKTELAKRNALRQEMIDQKQAYMKLCRENDFKIAALKKQKKQAKNNYQATVEKIKVQINPYKRQLRQEYLDKQREYKRKKSEIADILKDTKEITALMDKKDRLVLTQEEVKTWNDRLSSLIARKAQLEEDTKQLKKDIEIMKLKIKVMEI